MKVKMEVEVKLNVFSSGALDQNLCQISSKPGTGGAKKNIQNLYFFLIFNFL